MGLFSDEIRNNDEKQMTLDQAMNAAKDAFSEKLLGKYPLAVRILSKEIIYLRGALETIAFPKRGTETETWTINEIGEYAAKFITKPYNR